MGFWLKRTAVSLRGSIRTESASLSQPIPLFEGSLPAMWIVVTLSEIYPP